MVRDLKVISRALGHAQIWTTANVCANSTPAMLQRSAATMDLALRPMRDVAGG